jgi:hypothetical protein
MREPSHFPTVVHFGVTPCYCYDIAEYEYYVAEYGGALPNGYFVEPPTVVDIAPTFTKAVKNAK